MNQINSSGGSLDVAWILGEMIEGQSGESDNDNPIKNYAPQDPLASVLSAATGRPRTSTDGAATATATETETEPADDKFAIDGARFTSAIRAIENSQPEPNVVTQPANIATFNTAGYTNENVNAELDALFETQDIIGTQEMDENELGHAIAKHGGTHGVIVGNPNDSQNGEYTPIFYDKEKYEPVHVENIELPPDGERGATLAVLRDKESGALISVSNSHFVSVGDDPNREHREESERILKEKHTALHDKFNIAGDVMLGDFNMELGNNTGNFGDYSDEMPTFEHKDGDQNFDGVGVLDFDEDDTTSVSATDPHVESGGASDHNSVSRQVSFSFNQEDVEENKAIPTLHLHGVVTFEHENYRGHAEVIGFGNDEDNGQANDEASSIYVPSGTEATLYADSNTEDPNNETLVVTESRSSLPSGWNDRVSNVSVAARVL